MDEGDGDDALVAAEAAGRGPPPPLDEPGAPPGSGAAAARVPVPWSARLGMALLEVRAGTEEQGAGEERGGGGGPPAAWFSLLPRRVDLPTTTFTPDELSAACLPPGQADAARRVARSLRAAAEGPLLDRLKAAGAARGDPAGLLLWAAGAAQSRAFVDGRLRLVAPGIDLANHDGEAPTAAVRVVHSPGAVQGRAAAEEVAPPEEVEKEITSRPSRVELFAGPAGLRAGGPVTISYGPHTLESLFMVYGFVPASVVEEGGGRRGGGKEGRGEAGGRVGATTTAPPSPASAPPSLRLAVPPTSSTALFSSPFDAVAAAEAIAEATLGEGATKASGCGSLSDRASALAAAAPAGLWAALDVFPVGLSPSASALAAAAAAQVGRAFEARGEKAPSGGDVVLSRIAALLAAFAADAGGGVSAPSDAALLAAGEAGTHPLNARVLVAVRLRAGRVAILQAAAGALLREGGG